MLRENNLHGDRKLTFQVRCSFYRHEGIYLRPFLTLLSQDIDFNQMSAGISNLRWRWRVNQTPLSKDTAYVVTSSGAPLFMRAFMRFYALCVIGKPLEAKSNDLLQFHYFKEICGEHYCLAGCKISIIINIHAILT